MIRTVKAYKLARTDGWDFYTGKTINYRENIGKIVKCPNPNLALGICSSGVIHASKNPNDCFVGASIPCSAYQVKGKPVCGDPQKWGFTKLFIIDEIIDLNKLFRWKYTEAVPPINPLRGNTKKPGPDDIELLYIWALVGDSVGASVWAYIGSLFPNIKKWKYVEHKNGEYPFQSVVDLWKRGFVPSFDGKTWRLHSGKRAKIVYTVTAEDLKGSKQ